MKFGKQLEEYEQPEWRGHYINYRHFKLRLQEVKALKSPTPPSTPNLTTPLNRRQNRSLDGTLRSAPDAGKVWQDLEEEWRRILTSEAMRVGDFVHRGLHGLELQLRDLDTMNQTLLKKRRKISGSSASLHRGDSDGELGSLVDDEEEDDAGEFLELRVLEAVGLVAEGGRRLRGFAELNHAALYKILKKHDKVLGSKVGLGELLPALVADTRLGEISRFESLDEELRRLSLLSSQTEGLNASAEVARLAAGLGSKSTGMGPNGARNTELVLSFFLGCSTSLFLCIGVLLALPETSPKSFSTAYFLTSMPVFRVCFSVLLSLWCMGAVARICDTVNINHMFILNVDPRCRVTPEFFFSRAALLTTIWILVFGMYVVDYKWRVVSPIWSDQGFNQRSSVHFVFYPVFLMLLTLLGMIWPSRICRTRYKASVLRAVARTASAPLHPVDFSDNIVGDILTSLAKPLQDVPAAICYLASPHPQPLKEVVRFTLKGDTCTEMTHHVVLPIIAGLPYLFRGLQCLRRYQDTRDRRHLWNCGKYCACLAVVIVSSVWYDNFQLIVVVSTVATVYAGIWDIFIDWGLGPRELLHWRSGQDCVRRLDSRTGSFPASCPKVDAPAHHDRHFPPRVYLLCCILDLVARSTWVLSLMPITIISRNVVGRVVLVSIISSVEIFRRSMWAILRIEHEQVANASGFRALLWVPSKLHVGERWPPVADKHVVHYEPVSSSAKPMCADASELF
mmetsp:Transcript_80796/g.227478  ORF Transcript_80796/g.227478 Transcript_80796/m.227478 type:complete len:736 (-) Transcript_80796:119-2326(-)